MFALWKALYTSGHDAASLAKTADGWRLEGMAVFLKDGLPAAFRYELDIAPDWSTRSGAVEGFHGAAPIHLRVERDATRWRVNGVEQSDVEGLVDLDFGFTPATNCPQLRRMGLDLGETKRIDVAWIDIGENGLRALPQYYSRIEERSYDYESPQGPYRARLEIAPNGFVSEYPELWRMEACG